MSDGAALACIAAVICILVLAFGGEPDLMDAIIQRLLR